MPMQEQIEAAAQKCGELIAEKLFSGRKGHGNAPIVYMQISRADIVHIAQTAFELGYRSAQ